MLGLRPRPKLQHRPSLLDLIQRHNLEAGPAIPAQPLPSTVDDELPLQVPLPVSPTLFRKSRSNSTPPSTPQKKRTTSIVALPTVTLDPPPRPAFKAQAKANTTAKMAPSKQEKDENTGKVFSVSGPVIVAEDMIGCAMYELVCFMHLNILNDPVLTMMSGRRRPRQPRWRSHQNRSR